MLLTAQCNALNAAMPFLFERIDDETELLLPDNLLHSDSVIRQMVNEIEEADWQEIEIIGWLYQFYISEKKDQVIGKVVKSEDIPAATQLFTPNWIVKYMVQNTLGAKWLATYPQSGIRAKMEFYIEPAEQTDEVKAKLAAITPKELNPEEITFLDPACGSGHILVEAYDLFKEIYLERGYVLRDVPRLILEKNLFGLDIDDRATQMAAFALLMKARADDRRVLSANTKNNVRQVMSLGDADLSQIERTFSFVGNKELVPSNDLFPQTFNQMPLPVSASENNNITMLAKIFEDADALGSLINICDKDEAAARQAIDEVCGFFGVAENVDIETHIPRKTVDVAMSFVDQARIILNKYDCVAANPPYMGKMGMNGVVKKYIDKNYTNEKGDLFAAFIARGFKFLEKNGFFSMVTMQSWMFIQTYTKFRQELIRNKTMTSLLHLGVGLMGISFGTAAFSMRNAAVRKYKGTYFRIGKEFDPSVGAYGDDRYVLTGEEFDKLPDSEMIYWFGDDVIKVFSAGSPLSNFATIRVGLQTGDTTRFLRFWHEVDTQDTCPAGGSRNDTLASGKRWFFYNKGGAYRKWFGNLNYVVNWEDDGRAIKERKSKDLADGRITENNSKCWNNEHYFKPGISWSDVTSSGKFGPRYLPSGVAFDISGPTLIADDDVNFYLGILGSSFAAYILPALNPTMHFNSGNIAATPILQITKNVKDTISGVVKRLVDISIQDWSQNEENWSFASHPLINSGGHTIRNSFNIWSDASDELLSETKLLEENINRLILDAYEVNSVSADVDKESIALYVPIPRDAVCTLVSYAIGCMMGRYSLDDPGLIYANSGNVGFDPSRYSTFPADDDGIVPIMQTDWFDDDATNRVVEFIKVAWSPETLTENLKFVADSLGAKSGETPIDTIRRYLSSDFFKDHLKTYKKRPIYWLFSSGKEKAFEALVYLHRYNEGTLSRMRMEYVTPLQGRIASRIDQLGRDIDAAASTAAQNKLRKEQEKLKKQQAELVKFDEELRHYADMRIKLDLDDGVKVNYGKFGNLLAEAKAITGGSDE